MSESCSPVARSKAYKAAQLKFNAALWEWEQFLRDDAYRYAAHRVRTAYPDRPDIANDLDPDYEEGEVPS